MRAYQGVAALSAPSSGARYRELRAERAAFRRGLALGVRLGHELATGELPRYRVRGGVVAGPSGAHPGPGRGHA